VSAATRKAARKPARRPRRAPPDRARVTALVRALRRHDPDPRCALDYASPYELICSVILSAQCTDKRVNLVTPALFARYPDVEALARATQADVEELVRTTGFFRNKAKNLIGMAQALVANHGGEVPNTMEELHALPGVGRKTANVVLGNAFGINVGVTVDTHVARLSQRLRLTPHDDPVKIERDLMPLFPQADWALLSHLLIFHGRQVCIARRPRCDACVLADLCPSARIP